MIMKKFVRKWGEGSFVFYPSKEGYIVFCLNGEVKVLIGLVYRQGKSWKYSASYVYNEKKIKSKKKSGSLIKAARMMAWRCGIIAESNNIVFYRSLSLEN
jgi:hypothetical protein